MQAYRKFMIEAETLIIFTKVNLRPGVSSKWYSPLSQTARGRVESKDI